MNDFRVYDHALSPLEVKEISKGLILHYPLNRNGWGQENLWRNSSCKDNLDGIFQNTVKFTITTKDGYKCAHLSGVKGSSNATGYLSIPDAMVPEAGAWYTISADMRIDNYSAGSTNPYVGIYFGGDYLNTDNTGGWYGGRNYSGDGKADAQTFVNTYNNKGWHRVTCTAQYIHGGDEYKKGAFQMGYIYARDFTGDLYVKNIKFEKGKIATLWCPNSSDTFAATMGLNDNIEYDVSGYGNNGIKVGTTYSSDTPKYNVSTVFDENADTITVGPCYSVGQTIDTMSCAIWFKTNTLNSTAPNLVSLGENSFFRFRLTSATSVWYYMKVGTTMKGKTFSCKTLTDNDWHHIVIIFNKGYVYSYIDGELVDTENWTSVGTYLTCELADDHWHLAGFGISTESFKGNESDFRLYATALSADDVKSLYNNSAYIDNQGNIYGAVYEEV